MWRGFVGSCWLGPGCLVLRADTRENPVGKNGVMTPLGCTNFVYNAHITMFTLFKVFMVKSILITFISKRVNIQASDHGMFVAH